MMTDANNPVSDEEIILDPDDREQDQMNEAICLKLNDLEYRVDDLELSQKNRETKQQGTGKEARD